MKEKTVMGIHLVNEMVRNGWKLVNVRLSGTKPEFLMIKEDKVSQQESAPPTETSN